MQLRESVPTPVGEASGYQQMETQGVDGEHLSFRAWHPLGAAPRAALLIVPGFKSHAGRYAWTGTQLANAGFAVYAVDLRGRGHSPGRPNDVQDFAEYVEDVEVVAAVVRTREPRVPLYVMGHSAGAVVAMLYVLRHSSEIAGVISLSIAAELPAPGFALSAFKVLSRVAPNAPVLRLKSEDFTRDPEELASMNADPLISAEVEPLETVAALVRAGERLREEIPDLDVPVLFMHGTADHAARPSGSEHLHEATGTADKQLVLYQDVLHEPLADLGRERVLADLVKWLNDHLSARGAQR